jgi:hypothetical protein
MAEQRAHEDPAPDRLSPKPFGGYHTALPSSTTDPYITHFSRYDVGAGDCSLPLGFDIGRPQSQQEHVSSERYHCPADLPGSLHPSHAYQAFGLEPVSSSTSTRRFLSQAQPHQYQLDRAPSSHYTAAQVKSSNLPLAESRRSHPQAPPQMHTRDPEMDEDEQSLSHDSSAQRAGAPTGVSLPSSKTTTNEKDGLLFKSLAHATAMIESTFRAPLKDFPDDDVEEVEQHKRKHVLSIVKALKHKGFLPPPATKKAMDKIRKKQIIVPTSDDEKVKWQEWQESAQQYVEVTLNQRSANELVELNAWKVCEEIIKIHRAGYRFTEQKKDQKLKCSARIQEAVRVIQEYAIVRSKLLKDDKIPKFCISPQGYAKVTIAAHRNNSVRSNSKKQDGNREASEQKATRRIVKMDGSVARRFQARPSASTKENKRSRKAKSDSAVGTADDSEEGSTSAAMNESKAGDSMSGDSEEEEDEDAEGQDDDDADRGSAEGEPETGRGRARVSFRSVDDSNLDEDPFKLPEDLSAPFDEDESHPARFDNTSASMTTFQPFPQTNTRGFGTFRPSVLAMQALPVPISSATTFSTSGYGYAGTLAMGAGYEQPDIFSTQGLPHAMAPPTSYLPSTIAQTPTVPSSGLPNSQDPQLDVRKTRTSKRRKL